MSSNPRVEVDMMGVGVIKVNEDLQSVFTGRSKRLNECRREQSLARVSVVLLAFFKIIIYAVT